MGRYCLNNVAAKEPGRIPGPVGSAVAKPLATKSLPGGVTDVFVQMLCAQCPLADSNPTGGSPSAEIPVAFRLQGTAVESAQAADVPGDPMWFDQIKTYFLHELWGIAQNQQLSQQQAASSLTGATRAAACPHT